MEKKALLLLLPILISFSMTSCSADDKYLEKPENTNLTYWITQKVSDDDFDDCTYLPGWMGADEYLDGRYKAAEGYMDTAPAIHVTYLVTGYPDLKDSAAVTYIEITDPEIYVYGLTMDSGEAEIEKVMSNNNFKKSAAEESGLVSYYKNNVVISILDSRITISASTTNKTGIIY